MFFSYDSSHSYHPDGGWRGFIIWSICMIISGISWVVDQYIVPVMDVWLIPLYERYSVTPFWQNLDSYLSIALHILSGISLMVGIIVGIVTIQDKLKSRKNK